MSKPFLTKNQAIQLTSFLLRVVSGVLIMQSGGMKLFNWFNLMPGGETPKLMSQIGIGALLEFAGGIAISIGLFTRPVAFVLAGEMAVAYWQFHAHNGTWPIQNQGQPAVMFCFIFLFFAAYGSNTWSVDAWIKRRM